MVRHLIRAATLVALLIAAVGIAGCGLLGGEPKLIDVGDPEGVFHVKIPEDWSSESQKGLIAISATEEMPQSAELENLSIGIFSTTVTTDTPPADTLAYIVDERAKSNEWVDPKVGEPVTVRIGDRDGYMVDASGSYTNGVAFAARYYFINTSGVDLLVIAAAPADSWDEVKPDVETLVSENWFWHRPADEESTATAQ